MQTPSDTTGSNVDQLPSMKYALAFTNQPREYIVSHMPLCVKAEEASGQYVTRYQSFFYSPSPLSAGDRITGGQTEKERLQT